MPSKKLADFSTDIRNSTIKRLQLVPSGKENWRPFNEAMSFADLAQHLIDADLWLYKKIKNKNLEPMVGQSGLGRIDNREEYQNIIDELIVGGERRCQFISSLRKDNLEEMIFDLRFGNKVSVWWIIARGNLDHEIHHRGQIATYLRLIEMQSD